MATIPVYSPAGERAGELELAADVFGLEPHMALMHQAVVTTLANMRQGTADTKTRGEVHHTTKKLFRQKGTGRARQGMKSAPHWKGGGVVFGPHPRDYSLALPKKMRRKALLSALSARANDEALLVVESLSFEKPQTRIAAALLETLGVANKKVLLVLDQVQPSVVLSFRNLPRVLITTSDSLGTYDILAADVLVFTKAGLDRLTALKQEAFGTARWLAKQQGGVA